MLRFLIVAQADPRKPCSQAGHALAVLLQPHERATAPVASPAQADFACSCVLRTVDAEEDGAGDVVFRDEDVDECVPVPLEIPERENVTGDGADGVGFGGVDASFRDELGDDGFGEDVEEVDEEGGAGSRCVCWKGGRRGEEGEDGDLWAGNLKRGSESVDYILELRWEFSLEGLDDAYMECLRVFCWHLARSEAGQHFYGFRGACRSYSFSDPGT